MNIFRILMTVFAITSSAAFALPTCEQARQSKELSNKTQVQILAEVGKLQVRANVILERARDLAQQIRSGAVDRDSGMQQLNEYKAESRRIEARNQELKALSECINR